MGTVPTSTEGACDAGVRQMSRNGRANMLRRCCPPEGDFVLSVSEGTAKGVPTAFYDVLRFDDGRVVEHWDVIPPIPTEGLANGNGMFGF